MVESMTGKAATAKQLRSAVGALSKAELGFKLAVKGCERFEEVYREVFGSSSSWAMKESEQARALARRMAALLAQTLRAMGGAEEAGTRKRKGGAK